MAKKTLRMPGLLTPSAVGVLGKEAVRRAIKVIRRVKFKFDVTEKPKKNGKADYLTSADLAAQEMYLRFIRENFPGYGVIAEERGLSIPCTIKGVNAFFTVDPLDGTKAFIRRQSDGIGTMLSLVINGEVVAAFVGDVMTQEIYYFRPDSKNVHRMTLLDDAEGLVIDVKKPLKDQYLLLRDMPEKLDPLVRTMARDSSGLFKDTNVCGGSIGITFAKLWKQEVGAIILKSDREYPWDYTPVLGISEKLGFVSYEIFFSRHIRATKKMVFAGKTITHLNDRIFIHKSRVPEFKKWLKAHGVRFA